MANPECLVGWVFVPIPKASQLRIMTRASTTPKRKELEDTAELKDMLKAFQQEVTGRLDSLQGKQEAIVNEIGKTVEFANAQHAEKLQAIGVEIQKVRTEFGAFKAAAEARIGKQDAVIRTLRDELSCVRAVVESRERQDRAANVLVIGVSEGDADPLQIVSKLLPQVPQGRVVSAQRLGKAREGPDARPRPMLVKFSSVQEKHLALRSSKDLRAQKIYIDMDLTPAQKENRSKKMDRFRLHKTQGHRPFWRYDRLLYTEGNQVREDGAPPGGSPPPAPQTAYPHFRPSQIPRSPSAAPSTASPVPSQPSSSHMV